MKEKKMTEFNLTIGQAIDLMLAGKKVLDIYDHIISLNKNGSSFIYFCDEMEWNPIRHKNEKFKEYIKTEKEEVPMDNVTDESVKIEARNKLSEHIHEARKIAKELGIDFACVVLLDDKRVLNATNGDSLKLLGIADILKNEIIKEIINN